MSTTKKRKTTFSEASQDAGPLFGTSSTTSSSNSSKRSRPMKFSATPKKINTAFVDEKNALYHKAVQQIQSHYEEALTQHTLPDSDGAHPCFCRDSIYQVREKLAQARDLYARPPGDVIVMGQEDTGQCGLVRFMGDENVGYPPTLNTDLLQSFIQVAAGGMHSVALTQDGKPFSFGCPDDGQIGRLLTGADNDKERSSFTPTEVTGFYSANGGNEDGTIIQVAAGDANTLFLTISGNVYETGMFKDGDSGEFCHPRPPNDPTNAEKKKHSSVKGNRKVPVHVYRLPKRAKYIASGGSVSAAITEDGDLYTWGMGVCGQQARSANMTKPDENGNYNLDKVYDPYKDKEYDLDAVDEHFMKPKPVLWEKGTGRKIVTEVSLGMGHILVLARSPGQAASYAYSAGLANYGQTGHGDHVQRHELTLIEELRKVPMAKVGAGCHHSMFLSTKGVVYTCGRADYGQIGYRVGNMDGQGDFQLTPRRVPFPIANDPAKVGRIVDVACGDSHCLALTSTGQIYTWGFGEYGQCGNDPAVTDKDIQVPMLAENWFPATDLVATCISGGCQHTLVVAKRYRAA